MRVNPDIEGRVYPPSPAFEVGREKIREFAEAINSWDPVHRDPQAAQALGYPDVIAPPTLAVMVAQRSDAQVIIDPDAGVDFTRVVHGEQRFVHHRPIVAGDVLIATLHVDGVSTRGKHATITTRSEIADAQGQPVTTATSTILVRGGGRGDGGEAGGGGDGAAGAGGGDAAGGRSSGDAGAT